MRAAALATHIETRTNIAKLFIPLADRIEVFPMVLRRSPGTPAVLPLAGVGKIPAPSWLSLFCREALSRVGIGHLALFHRRYERVHHRHNIQRKQAAHGKAGADHKPHVKAAHSTGPLGH